MRLPFISRSVHDEVVSLLREQYEKCDTERRQLLDYICRAMGRGLFEELNHPTPSKEVEDPHYIPQHRKSARRFTQEIQNSIYEQLRDAESEPKLSDAQKVIASTVQEGIAAAKGGKQ